MATTLVEGRDYGLASNVCSNGKKTLIHLKLTDSALRAFEEYSKIKNGCSRKPTIQFTGNNGEMNIPCQVSSEDPKAERSFSINLTNLQSDPNGSFDCIQLRNSSSLQCQGSMHYKITTHANNDVYSDTRKKIAFADTESKKLCAKEIKMSGRFSGKKIRKVISSEQYKSTQASKTTSSHSPLSSRLPSLASFPSSSSSSSSLSRNNGQLSSNKVQSHSPVNDQSTKKSTSLLSSNNGILKLGSQNTSLAIKWPCRDRMIHLLALKAYRKPEIVCRLMKEGVYEKDKHTLTSLLNSVATYNKNNLYSLARHAWQSVRLDWPFYTEEQKKIVARNRQEVEAMASGSPSISPVIPASNSPSPPQKRPSEESYDVIPSKKQRISHHNKHYHHNDSNGDILNNSSILSTTSKTSNSYHDATGRSINDHLDGTSRSSTSHHDATSKSINGHHDTTCKTSNSHDVISRTLNGHHDATSKSINGHHDATSRSSNGYHDTTSRSTNGHHDATSRSTNSHHDATSRSTNGYHEATSRSTNGHHDATSRSTNGYHDATSRSTNGHHDASSRSTNGHHDATSRSTNGHHDASSRSINDHHDASSRSTNGHHDATSRSTNSHHDVTSRSINGHHDATSRSLNGHYDVTSRSINGHYDATSRSTNGHHDASSRSINGHHDATSRSTNGHHDATSKTSNSHDSTMKTNQHPNKQLSNGIAHIATNGVQDKESPVPESPSSNCENQGKAEGSDSPADYLSQYLKIKNCQQREEYKEVYRKEFSEYMRLHKKVDDVNKVFMKLKENMNKTERGSQDYMKLHNRVLQEYAQCKRDTQYLQEKQRWAYLHAKLGHIRNLIGEYDGICKCR